MEMEWPMRIKIKTEMLMMMVSQIKKTMTMTMMEFLIHKTMMTTVMEWMTRIKRIKKILTGMEHLTTNKSMNKMETLMPVATVTVIAAVEKPYDLLFDLFI